MIQTTHKEKSVLSILLLSLFVLFIAGCSGGSSLLFEPDFKYRSGTVGAEITLEGPSSLIIYDNEEAIHEYMFAIANKGAHDLTSSEVYVKITAPDGFVEEEDSFIITSLSEMTERLDELPGKSEYSTKGETTNHFLNVKANPPFPGGTATLKVDMCYTYETLLIDTVCIETNAQNKECDTRTYKYSQGQGGPVAIKEVAIRDKRDDTDIQPEFHITIENRQGGITALPGEFTQACNEQQNINKIKVSSITLGNEELLCNIEDGILDLHPEHNTLQTDYVTLICTAKQSFDVGNSFESPLYILLEYGYRSSDEMTIDMRRVQSTQ